MFRSIAESIRSHNSFAVTDFDLEAMRADPAARNTIMKLADIHASSRFADGRFPDYESNQLERWVGLGHIDDAAPPETCIYAD